MTGNQVTLTGVSSSIVVMQVSFEPDPRSTQKVLSKYSPFGWMTQSPHPNWIWIKPIVCKSQPERLVDVRQAQLTLTINLMTLVLYNWFFRKIIINLTMTFDPMTLTSHQLQALINAYPHTNFGFNPTNSIWNIDQKRSLMTDKPFPLDTTSDDFNTDTAHKQ